MFMYKEEFKKQFFLLLLIIDITINKGCIFIRGSHNEWLNNSGTKIKYTVITQLIYKAHLPAQDQFCK
jgi:hypothetical protein